MRDLKKAVLELMIKNRRFSDGYQYTIPSPETYPFQWFWDSCFHAIILSHFNTEDAKKELLSLVSRQFDDGMIPHMICWEYNEAAFKNPYLKQIIWGKEKTSSITQPPMLAIAVLRIYQKDADIKFLQKIYPAINKFCKYLLSERDPANDNLVAIINPDESGEDNSPRFDEALGLPARHTMEENFKKRLKLFQENIKCDFDAGRCMINFFWVKDVPINVIFIENLKATSEIAKALGKEEDSKFFIKKAEEVKQAMKKLMFEDKLY